LLPDDWLLAGDHLHARGFGGGLTVSEDPIVAEVRRIRLEHSARFGNDLDAIFRDLQARQRTSGRTYVSLPPRRVTAAEQEAARIRLQQMLEKDANSDAVRPTVESPNGRLAG
jgi:hypothetical protein